VTTKLGIALAEAGQLTRVDALLRDRLEPERSGRPFLVFHDPDGQQHRAQLDRTLRIGRLPDNEIALTWDGEVSRRHAHVESSEQGWTLVDDASRNGSYVNGERIAGQRALRDGDVLRFGDTVVLFRSPVPAQPGAPGALASDQLTHVPRSTRQG